MTVVSGTFLTYSAIGNREDLVDEIYNISPTDTPFQAMIAKVKARAVTHEWQTDSLASAAANAQLEGDDFTYSTPSATSRLKNVCQILYKTCVVSGTQDAVDKAGRAKEMVYQMMKRNKELNRDVEFAYLNNQTPNLTGTSSSARALRPVVSWYSTNASRGTSGSAGSASAAVTDGTQRALTETLVKAQIQAAWTAGGDIDYISVGPFNKTVISGFTGNNTRTQDTSDKKLVAAIDVYTSDFGTHKVVANKFQRDRDVHLLTSDLWAQATLRPKFTKDIAATGDATKGAIITELTLESRNEAGSAIVADVTTS